MKACSRCGAEKRLTEFSKDPNNKSGLRSECKECGRLRRAEYNSRPEVVKKQADYDRTRERSEMYRKSRLKRLYSLTPEEYDQILEYQDGVCYICRKPPKDGKRLHVDHDHKTGIVRGLLCAYCNRALGAFRDDTERLLRSADYIKDPPVAQALGRTVYGQKGRVNKRSKRGRKPRRSNT